MYNSVVKNDGVGILNQRLDKQDLQVNGQSASEYIYVAII